MVGLMVCKITTGITGGVGIHLQLGTIHVHKGTDRTDGVQGAKGIQGTDGTQSIKGIQVQMVRRVQLRWWNSR